MALSTLTPPRITATSLTHTEVQEQNEAVSKWSSMVQRRLRQSLQQFNNGKNSTVQRPGRSERMLRASLFSKTKKDYGVIDRVSIQFERHDVFVHKGVGNGYKMKGGTVIRTTKKQRPIPGHALLWNGLIRSLINLFLNWQINWLILGQMLW